MSMGGTVRRLEGGRKREDIVLFFSHFFSLFFFLFCLFCSVLFTVPSFFLSFHFSFLFCCFLAILPEIAAAAAVRSLSRNTGSSMEMQSSWFLLRQKGPSYSGKSQMLQQPRQLCAPSSGLNNGSVSSRSLGNTTLACANPHSFWALMGFGSDEKSGR